MFVSLFTYSKLSLIYSFQDNPLLFASLSTTIMNLYKTLKLSFCVSMCVFKKLCFNKTLYFILHRLFLHIMTSVVDKSFFLYLNLLVAINPINFVFNNSERKRRWVSSHRCVGLLIYLIFIIWIVWPRKITEAILITSTVIIQMYVMTCSKSRSIRCVTVYCFALLFQLKFFSQIDRKYKWLLIRIAHPNIVTVPLTRSVSTNDFSKLSFN